MIINMANTNDVLDFKLAIVNAIYFKQNWKKSFDKEKTKKDKFNNADGSLSEVDMMHSLDRYKSFQGVNEKVIKLPYNDDNTSMLVILPNKMKNYEISNEVYDKFTSKMIYQKVNFDLPKFTYETPTFELKPYLEKMVLKLAFSDGANFSKIRKEKI